MTGTVVDSVVEDGHSLELRQREQAWDVVDGGRVILSTEATGVERPLAELAIEIWRGRDDITVLVAGLGAGHVVRAALDQPGVVRVDVVEPSAALIGWEQRHFGPQNGAATADPRVRVHHGELTAFVRAPRIPDQAPDVPDVSDGWFVLLAPVLFQSDEGLDILEQGLRPGGVLGLLSQQRDDELGKRMHRRLQQASRVGVPTNDGMRYIYRGRRGPRRSN